MALGAWIACSVLTLGAAHAERRVALVIGNAEYVHAGVLANTLNDAHAMTALFKGAGFDLVDEKINLGVVEMKRAVRDFAAAARTADIAVVYYSGHGLEVSGSNYLVPVDARLSGVYDVDDEAVALDRLQTATQSASRLSLIILDACRENPFSPPAEVAGATRGISAHTLGVQQTGADTLIAYAAKAGSVSYDGTGPNGPFTAALVKYITEPGLDIRIALGKVRDEVLSQTWGKQEPYVYGSLGGGTVSLAPAAPAPSGAADASNTVATDYAMAERIGAADAWRSFLANHAAGYYADLARAQLDKLTAADHSKLPPENELASNASPSRNPTPAPPLQVAALPPPGPTRTPEMAAPELPVATNPDDDCKQEDGRLAQLRKNPSGPDVTAFAKQMTCAALRPQVNRLLESLGLPAVAAAPPRPKPAATALPAQAAISPCVRDRETLDRLRTAQDPDAVAKFAGTLACEALRPQLERLMESLGVKAAITPPSQTRGVTPELRATAPAGDQRAICAKEGDDLVKLRADPQRQAVQRFANALNCEALKPQVARLLESLGE